MTIKEMAVATNLNRGTTLRKLVTYPNILSIHPHGEALQAWLETIKGDCNLDVTQLAHVVRGYYYDKDGEKVKVD